MTTTKPTRSRRRKPGDLATLRRVLWTGVLSAEELLGSENPELKLRAVHAIAQVSASYAKLCESSDLEARIVALEQELHREPEPFAPRRIA
mgnify:CR=1 FL=1